MTDYMRAFRKVDIYSGFYHAIPDEGILTLDELHSLVRNIWLASHDQGLESERASRCAGRPKSAIKELPLNDDLRIRTIEVLAYSTHPDFISLFVCRIIFDPKFCLASSSPCITKCATHWKPSV